MHRLDNVTDESRAEICAEQTGLRTVLNVGHDPRAELVVVRGLLAPPAGIVAKVDGLHRSIAVVVSIRFGVAVVLRTADNFNHQRCLGVTKQA